MNHTITKTHSARYYAHPTAAIDTTCQIGRHTEIWQLTRVMAYSTIGDHCYIGPNVTVPSSCSIGDKVRLSDGVTLAAGTVLEHDVSCEAAVVFADHYNPNDRAKALLAPPTVVKHGADIGANTTIVRGCTIGCYSTVAAGTVVNHDVPNYAIVSGNPMHVIGWRCRCQTPLQFGSEPSNGANLALDIDTCRSCGQRYQRHDRVIEPLDADTTGRGDDAATVTMAPAVAVPLLDLKPQFAKLEPAITLAIRDVCSHQQFAPGPRVQRFEQRLAAYCDSRFGIGVSSGTDAKLLALMVLDIGPGDAVITSPYADFSTAGSIVRVGAKPLFCDIEPNTFNLSPSAVTDFIRQRCTFYDQRLIEDASGRVVKAIMVSHLFGLSADMQPLLDLARRYRLRVIEDATQALGARYATGCRVGSLGDIGCFSFSPDKTLGAFGAAGLCLTNDPALAERLRLMRNHGAEPDASADHHLIGGNFRLDELQAAVLDIKLDCLDAWLGLRQQHAAFYDHAFTHVDLDDQLVTPWVPHNYFHSYSQYIIRSKQRDELRQFLSTAAIGTALCYPTPLHMQPCFSHLELAADDCPEARAAASEALAIPIYPELSAAQRHHVVDSVIAMLH